MTDGRSFLIDGVYVPPHLARAMIRAVALLRDEHRRDGILLPAELSALQRAFAAKADGQPLPEPRREEELWLSVAEAAQRLGCSQEWVRRLAREERIRARRRGRAWQIAAAVTATIGWRAMATLALTNVTAEPVERARTSCPRPAPCSARIGALGRFSIPVWYG